MEKDSIVFYKSFYEAIREMPKENQLELYDAIFEKYFFDNEIKLTGLSKGIFQIIKPNIDSANKRYFANIENGKKGGRPKKQNPTKTQQKPNENPMETQHKSEKNLNENDNDNENENENILCSEDVAKIDKMFIETLGSTNLYNIRECIGYLDKLPLEVIEYALKKTARKGAKWDYAMTILDSYVEKKLDTLEKIQADEIEFKNKTEGKKQNNKLEQRQYTESDLNKLYANLN